MGRFQIMRDLRGEYRYRLLAANGEIILGDSEGHTYKAACEKSIASVKVNAPIDARFDRMQSAGGYYFRLKAANGEIIGVSEIYTSARGRDMGIESVKRNAAVAPVTELA